MWTRISVQKVYYVYYALLLLIVAVFVMKLGWSIFQNGGLKNVQETFQPYNVKPFGYKKTGCDPLRMYRKDMYRKPYRYPLKIYKSYPEPHFSFLE